jgi:hypothetical protein
METQNKLRFPKPEIRRNTGYCDILLKLFDGGPTNGKLRWERLLMGIDFRLI